MNCKRIVLIWGLLTLFLNIRQDVFSLAQSAGSEGCNATAVHDLGYTGQGVSIGLISLEHARYTHEAFYDKDETGNPIGDSHVHWFDPTGANLYEPYWHDTSMAGILAGRGGVNYPEYLGMAPGAEIYSAKITRSTSDTDPNRLVNWTWFQKSLDFMHENNCRVTVTGVQFPASYDTDYFPLTMLYDYYAYAYDILFITAAGNGHSYITIFGTSYNSITTGGLVTTQTDLYRRVGTTSNPGPTTDSRQKPDITAPAQNLWVPTSSSDHAWKNEGYNGETSWAGPHVAGVAALLYECADNSTEEADDGQSLVIKAVMINSAFPNILDKNGNSTTGQAWNAHRGYGRLDAMRAVTLLGQPKIQPNDSTSRTGGWSYQNLPADTSHSYFVTDIPQGYRLVVTLTWKRRVVWKDKPGLGQGTIGSNELTSYFADLDLEVYDPNSRPMLAKLSESDNLEKADLLICDAGDYEIRIVNQSSSELPNYSMAFELLPPLPGDFNTDAIVDTDDLTILSEWWLQTNCSGCSLIDLEPDGIINGMDLDIFTEYWLQTDLRYCPLP